MQSWEQKKCKCLQHVLREIADWDFINSALSHHFVFVKDTHGIIYPFAACFRWDRVLTSVCTIISVFQMPLL